jgi:hypothetical protein
MVGTAISHVVGVGMKASLSLSLPCPSSGALSPPTDNLYLRLFADTSYFALSGGKITTWQGTGASGKAASQGTALLQPSPGTGINGRTTVYFGGSQYMTIPSVAIGVFDIYVVTKTSSGAAIILEHSTNGYGTGNGSFLFTGTNAGSVVTRSSLATSRNPSSAAWAANGVACLIRAGHNGTHATHILERDGATVAGTAAFSSNPGTGIVTDIMFLGARSGGFLTLTGDIGEILIYDSAPDATRAAQVLAYCRQYWGTP